MDSLCHGALSASYEAVLRQRHRPDDDAAGTVAEAPWYGNLFLRHRSERLHYNLAEDLLVAAARCAREHELMWRVWDLAGGSGNPDAYAKLADAAIRRQMVPLILEARDKDAAAAESLERGLAEARG